MSKVEGGEAPIDPPSPLKASCNCFFFEASRVNKFARFHHYTLNNKRDMMGGTKCPPPGCDEPKKPGLDRVNTLHLSFTLGFFE